MGRLESITWRVQYLEYSQEHRQKMDEWEGCSRVPCEYSTWSTDRNKDRMNKGACGSTVPSEFSTLSTVPGVQPGAQTEYRQVSRLEYSTWRVQYLEDSQEHRQMIHE